MCEFSRVTSVDLETSHSVTLLMRLKIFFQKDLILGHSHQCMLVPLIWHPQKHRGSAEGKIAANLPRGHIPSSHDR